MDLIKSLITLKEERRLISRVIQNLSDEQLLIIPDEYKNNILWNLGHIIITQQFLHYTLSRVEMRVTKELVMLFRTGTSPAIWEKQPNIEEIKSLFIDLLDKFIEDYRNDLFTEFRPYKTSTGISLNDFEQAVAFDHFHEGTHAGIIMGIMKKL